MTVDGAWDGRRLSRAVIGLFALQVGLIYLLGAKKIPPVRAVPAHSKEAFWRITPEAGRPWRSGFPLMDDPWVFTSADSGGFSGLAWMHMDVPQHEWARWEVAADLIDFSERPMTNPLAGLELSSVQALGDVASWPAPQLAATQVGAPRAGSTLWHLEGDLVARAATNVLAFPSAGGVDVLASTRVQLGVAADGQVMAARVIAGSGSRPIDLQALQAARGLRFLPVSKEAQPEGLVWGVFVVEWFTEPVGGGK